MPIEQMMATNTMGHFWTIDMFLPGMLRQNAGQKYFNNHPLQHPCQHGEHQ
jgi:NADP-dependent 3-hydroxy acid dehydrogenase YdfG